MSNNNNISRYLATNKIHQDVSSLEQLLKQIKSQNHTENRSSKKGSNKLEKLFHKVLHLKSLVENGSKNRNNNHILNAYKHKNLVSIMRKFKTKSLLYHLEALIIEDLYKSIQKTKPKRSSSLNTSIETVSNSLSRPICKSETQLNLIGNNKNENLIDIIYDNILNYQLDYCLNDKIIQISSKINLNHHKRIPIKHFTTFILTSDEIEDDSHVIHKSQLFRKMMNEKTSIESFHIIKSPNDQICDETLKLSNKPIQSNFGDETQLLDPKVCTDTIDSDYSMANSSENTVDQDKDYQINHVTDKHRRIINIIQQCIQYFHKNSDVILHFFMGEPDYYIPINYLNYESYYLVKIVKDDDYFTDSLNIKEIEETFNFNSVVKVKKNRVIYQNICIPISFSRYFPYTNNRTNETMHKKDTRITHIETFCNCFIALQDTSIIENSQNKSDKRFFNDLLIINIHYNIIKGNELGCINMLRRLEPSLGSQIKITKEIRLTIHGQIEEDILKRFYSMKSSNLNL